jgi:sulfonate transport system substrate-binding protein
MKYRALFLLVWILWTVGCSVQREPVSIALALEPMSALVIIAETEGFLRKEGLDVKVKEYASGRLALQGMLKGQAEFATVADSPIVVSSFEREDFKVLATIASSDNEPKIVARRDRGIAKPTDLAGKRIGTQKGSAVHFFLYHFLLKHGLRGVRTTVVFLEPAELPSALARGEIDAFSMREPLVGEAQRLLGDNAILFEEKGLYLKTFNLVAVEDAVKNRTSVVNKILHSLIRAEEYTRQHPEQARRKVANRLQISEAVLSREWNELWLRVSLEQSLLLNLEDQARWAVSEGLVKGKKMPNFLNIIFIDPLHTIRPEAVRLIH